MIHEMSTHTWKFRITCWKNTRETKKCMKYSRLFTIKYWTIFVWGCRIVHATKKKTNEIWLIPFFFRVFLYSSNFNGTGSYRYKIAWIYRTKLLVHTPNVKWKERKKKFVYTSSIHLNAAIECYREAMCIDVEVPQQLNVKLSARQ